MITTTLPIVMMTEVVKYDKNCIFSGSMIVMKTMVITMNIISLVSVGLMPKASLQCVTRLAAKTYL